MWWPKDIWGKYAGSLEDFRQPEHATAAVACLNDMVRAGWLPFQFAMLQCMCVGHAKACLRYMLLGTCCLPHHRCGVSQPIISALHLLLVLRCTILCMHPAPDHQHAGPRGGVPAAHVPTAFPAVALLFTTPFCACISCFFRSPTRWATWSRACSTCPCCASQTSSSSAPSPRCDLICIPDCIALPAWQLCWVPYKSVAARNR